MIIGLTGGSGTGKSTVVKFFENNGYIVLDFDKISRDVCKKDMPCLKELVDNFGEEILYPDGFLNRKYLGAIVFSDREKLKLLNSITHKYIIEEMYAFLEKNKNSNIIFDAPLLFEAGIDVLCDKTISVLADKDIRINRIMKRDGITRAQAINRIKSQKDDDFYKTKSDMIIINNSSVDDLDNKLKELFK